MTIKMAADAIALHSGQKVTRFLLWTSLDLEQLVYGFYRVVPNELIHLKFSLGMRKLYLIKMYHRPFQTDVTNLLRF